MTMREDRSARRNAFNKRVLRLSTSRTYKDAYNLAERLEKKRYGERLYANYDSYRNARSYHRRNNGFT